MPRTTPRTPAKNVKRNGNRIRMAQLITRQKKPSLVFVALFGILVAAVGAYLLSDSFAAVTAKGEQNTSTVEPRLLSDPDVLFVGTFEDSNWKDLWGFGTFNNQSNTVVSTFAGISDQGNAMRGVTPANQQNGFGGAASFVNMGPGTGTGIGEQEEVYFRYRVNFPSEYIWTNTGGGGHGKLPGLAGKATGGADWAVGGGGKRWNGTSMINKLSDLPKADGWSARMLWQKDRGLSVYLYTPNKYGVVSGTEGTDTFRAFGKAIRVKDDPYNSSSANMKFNTGWNTVEEYVKMNTPGQADGVLKIWMNGKLGLHITDVMFRGAERPNLKTTQLFWTWFYGGPPSDYPHADSYVYFDDAVVSRSYIGPRLTSAVSPTPPAPSPSPTPTPPPATATGTLDGTLLNASGNVPRKARISITYGGVNHTFIPSNNGEYSITGIPEGTYQATYSAHRLPSQRVEVVIVGGQVTTQHVVLR